MSEPHLKYFRKENVLVCLLPMGEPCPNTSCFIPSFGGGPGDQTPCTPRRETVELFLTSSRRPALELLLPQMLDAGVSCFVRPPDEMMEEVMADLFERGYELDEQGTA